VERYERPAAREPVRPGAPLIGPGLGQEIDQHPNIRGEDVLPRRAGKEKTIDRNACECDRSQHGIPGVPSCRLAYSQNWRRQVIELAQ